MTDATWIDTRGEIPRLRSGRRIARNIRIGRVWVRFEAQQSRQYRITLKHWQRIQREPVHTERG